MGLYVSTRGDLGSDRYHKSGGQFRRAADGFGLAPHPHSLNPHTWHVAQPSTNASCEPQSGQAPMKSWSVSRARSTAAPSWPAITSRAGTPRSEEHTSELQSHLNLVCRLLLEKKKNSKKQKASLGRRQHARF